MSKNFFATTPGIIVVGAAMAHNRGTASSGTGIGMYGAHATIIGFVICLIIGFAHIKRA